MKNQDTCILYFVKYPQKGEVKQRLAADLDEDIVVILLVLSQDISQIIEHRYLGPLLLSSFLPLCIVEGFNKKLEHINNLNIGSEFF